MDRNRRSLARLDEKACLDFLAGMVRHKSYSRDGGRARAGRASWPSSMRALGLEAELQPVEGDARQRHRPLAAARAAARACCSTAISTPIR